MNPVDELEASIKAYKAVHEHGAKLAADIKREAEEKAQAYVPAPSQ